MCENFIATYTKDASLSLFIFTKSFQFYCYTCEVRLAPHHALHVTSSKIALHAVASYICTACGWLLGVIERKFNTLRLHL